MKYVIFSLCLVLIGCNDTSNRDGSHPPPSPTRPTDCSTFKDFFTVFSAMRRYAGSIAEQTSQSERLSWASALLADHLSRSYAAPKELWSQDREAQKFYLKYFNWIFTEDGFVRLRPSHPLTNSCLEKE